MSPKLPDDPNEGQRLIPSWERCALEPRDRAAERHDGDNEGGACPALPQPDVLRARLRVSDALVVALRSGSLPMADTSPIRSPLKPSGQHAYQHRSEKAWIGLRLRPFCRVRC